MGCPRSHELSNTVPSLNSAPTYCTETFWPAAAFGPLPFLMSLITSLVGGSPPGTLIVGFSPSFPLTETLPAGALVGGASVGASVAASVGAGVAALSSEESSLEPQPDRAST